MKHTKWIEMNMIHHVGHTENSVPKNILIKFMMAQKKSDIMLSRHIVRFDFTTPAISTEINPMFLIQYPNYVIKWTSKMA